MVGYDDSPRQPFSVPEGIGMVSGATEPGKVIAFYSYKGGTGRSMALANVGCILAQHPDVSSQILLVDWDLEAPGLHRYFRRHLYGAFHGSEEQQEKTPGVIDLFVALRDRINESDNESLQDYESTKRMLGGISLEEYIISTDIPGLHLMKAGCFDSEYAGKVVRFDWPAIYAKAPFLIRAFADRLAADYRYVLIDSRTGLTDTSGICTMLLPEILVAVFTPNRQSLTGVIDLIREAGQYRSQSDDLRPLTVYPLPSRIEASEPTLRQQWRFGDANSDIVPFQRSFEKVFKEIYGLSECNLTPYFDDVQIQHVPKYAYGEDIAVIDEGTRDRLSLTESFQRFTRKLVRGQLPWEAAGTLADAASEEIADVQIPEDIKAYAADAYLGRIAGPTASLRRRAFTINLNVIVSMLAAIGAYIVPEFLFPSSRLAGSFNISFLVLTNIVVIFSVYFLMRWAERIRSAASEVDREVRAFREKTPPYDREDALERLRARVDPILAQSGTSSSRRGSGSVFMSYRREEQSYALRLASSINRLMGPNTVFLDVESIPLGADFREAVESRLRSADVVLVVMGPEWLKAHTSSGERRLDDASDFVRREIASALRQNTRVIPVIVGGAAMPSSDELPPEIAELSYRNAIEIRNSRWEADVARLSQGISGL
jgi:cellulose biosynthesis protein BcsQ